MFNFTTQTVYNSISESGANRNLYVVNGKKPAIRIGNTRFDAANIESIEVKNPTVENLAEVTFDMEDILIPQDSNDNEITARIVLYIGLSMNSLDSFYANSYVYKGKPLYIEFAVKKGDTADVVAKRVKANADKYFLFTTTDEKFLDVVIEATAADSEQEQDAVGTVTFKGVNGYQQIKSAILQKFDPNAKTVDCCSNQGEFVDVITGVPVTYTTSATGAVTTTNNKLDETGNAVALDENEVAITPGLEAFGDYNWIIHNLRLPTAANTNFWAPTRGEMPIVGQQYTQFIIRMVVDRDGIAGEAVGLRVTSVTTHVLYVAGLASQNGTPAKLVKDKFTALASSKIKTTADTALQNPF